MSQLFAQMLDPLRVPACVAEVGINHNGDIKIAMALVDAALAAGADAVKFQTFKANEICADRELMFTYQSQGRTITEPMLDMFQRCELTEHEWYQLKTHCDQVGIVFFSTPQNVSDLELLLRVGVDIIKIGSDDLTNTPLIRDYAETGLPILLAIGMADGSEVYKAIDAMGWFSGKPGAVLVCTSTYPTRIEDANIARVTTLLNSYPGLLVGFSDHTQGHIAAAAATALGARVFEKHFTLRQDMPGPDHWFSETPDSLARWITTIHDTHRALGDPFLRPVQQERGMRGLARRSICARCDIAAGEVFSLDNLCLRRPGNGLAPEIFDRIIGTRARAPIKANTHLSFSDIDDNHV